MLKLYVQDNNLFGMIVVTALNEEMARSKMCHCENYDHERLVEEFEITEYFLAYNLGDM